jgi:hypothetical protein
MTALVLASSCGSSPAPAFHPAGKASAAPSRTSAVSSTVTWPPFGSNVHIDMTGWTPSEPSQVPAVIADKDFQLAYLYSSYRGGQDQRWASYASPAMHPSYQRSLSGPDTTTQSFTGTVRYFQMQAFPDPNMHGAVDVSSCEDVSRAPSTDLHSGKVIPGTPAPDQAAWRYTDVIGKSGGQWKVVSNYPSSFYPRERDCKP